MGLEDQLAVLKSRGLIIDDEAIAVRQLSSISYYRLASYWRPMEIDKASHQFKPNSHFANAMDLYNFDMKLRSLIFTAIQKIEIAFRSKVIHSFSLPYGSFWFMDSTLFKNPAIFARCLGNLDDELKRTKEEFVLEHYAKYDSPAFPPVWKTMEVASFGTVSKIFSNFADNKVKKDVAKGFGLPQHLFLESWITAIAVLRNCVAHHARTWNRIFSIKPQLPSSLQGDWIADRNIPPFKLYPFLCTMQYLLAATNDREEFKEGIKSLLAQYPNVDATTMGFPAHWQDEPLWR